MSIQKFHREAYDIVLSNYPEGEIRERETRRFERAATAPSARELFSDRRGAGAAREAEAAGRSRARRSRRAPARTTRRRCWPGGRAGRAAARQERRLGLRRAREAGRGRQEPRLPRPRDGARQRGRLRARGRARRQMSRKPAERPEQRAAVARQLSEAGGGAARRPAAGEDERGERRPRRRRPRQPGPPPTPAPPAPAQPRIYVVSELLRAARLTLESRFADVRVEGEVSGLKRSGNGHIYFCAQGRGGALDCVLFSREAARLKFTLEEGMAVRCRGRLTLYEARGKFQMTVADDRADRRGRAGAGVRAAQADGSAPRGCSTRRASGRCRSCRAGSAW